MYIEYNCIALLCFLSITISWTNSVFMSLMYSILLYLNTFLVLLSLGFEFLALVNILIYVGALAVLFLFVIMLLEIPTTELRAYNRGYSLLSIFCFISVCFLFLNSQNNTIFSFIPTMEAMYIVGHGFYILYADVLILNSLVLTISLFGALVLAHN